MSNVPAISKYFHMLVVLPDHYFGCPKRLKHISEWTSAGIHRRVQCTERWISSSRIIGRLDRLLSRYLCSFAVGCRYFHVCYNNLTRVAFRNLSFCRSISSTTMDDPSPVYERRSTEKKASEVDESIARIAISSQPMASIQDDDERLLARIGYKQVRDSLAAQARRSLMISRSFVVSSRSGLLCHMRYQYSASSDRSPQHTAYPSAWAVRLPLCGPGSLEVSWRM